MTRRTFDAAFLNDIANLPEVRPCLLGNGPIDMASVIQDAQNYALVCKEGGFVLTAMGGGVYEVHTIFRPGEAAAIPAMLSAMEWMFTRTDCQRIVSRVPETNRAAKGLAIKGGLQTVFTRDDEAIGRTEYVELTLTRWAMRTTELEQHGERFHEPIAAALELVRPDLPDHPDDPSHERAVGAALLMIERGQIEKGVVFYNQWAVLAGYPPIRLLDSAPATIDCGVPGIVELVVGLGECGMEVQLCR